MVQNAGSQFATSLLSHNFKSIAQIKKAYDDPHKQVRILLVPGHEPGVGGATFQDLKEREMTVEVAQQLQNILEKDPEYKVFITRDSTAWSPEFEKYFKDNWDDIVAWTNASKEEFRRMVTLGSTTETTSTVFHNNAQPEVALRLYGISKWSNENDIDIILHIHFNDNRRKDTTKPGEYSGISLYVPAGQYGNSTTTKAIAQTIFTRLSKYNATSDLPGEVHGIIDEPELIAVGSHNTIDAASVLIEYGYIYEEQFKDPQVRSLAIKDLAYQTYLGIQDFFDANKSAQLAKTYDTLILPYEWKGLSVTTPHPTDVFALQTALIFKGVYPPANKTKNDCPRTGIIGECTRAALQVIQNKYGISEEKGSVGRKTLELLNQL